MTKIQKKKIKLPFQSNLVYSMCHFIVEVAAVVVIVLINCKMKFKILICEYSFYNEFEKIGCK